MWRDIEHARPGEPIIGWDGKRRGEAVWIDRHGWVLLALIQAPAHMRRRITLYTPMPAPPDSSDHSRLSRARRAAQADAIGATREGG